MTGTNKLKKPTTGIPACVNLLHGPAANVALLSRFSILSVVRNDDKSDLSSLISDPCQESLSGTMIMTMSLENYT